MRKFNFVIVFVICLSLLCTGCNVKNDTNNSNVTATAKTEEKSDGMGIDTNLPSVGLDYENRSVKLNSGYEMPILGLGTWTLSDEEAEECVYAAIQDGYRLFDTARYYGTQAGVGRAVRRAIEEGLVTHEQIFVTTKIVSYGFDDYDAVIKECNEKIGLDYIDLMLIHQQDTDEIELYQAIERAIADGIVHSLGISNYYTQSDFERITADASVMPAIIQNENHIFYQNTDFQEYVSQFGTVMESYYPFGGRGHTSDLLKNEVITSIADAHGKTSAQVILRWHLQAGYIAIPGSSNPEHIAENYGVFDFELSDDEMNQIASLNTGERYENAEAKTAIDESLRVSGLDYFDLMIIHAPQPRTDFHEDNHYFEGNLEAWRALEEAHGAGKLKAIGVSNFEEIDLDNILKHCTVKPVVNQILCHIGNTPFALIDYCNKNGIQVEAYSPVAHGEMLKNGQIAAMAQKYGVTVLQLCIRYCLQLGLVTLPKTANPAHMSDNAKVDFIISEEDMTTLKNADKIKNYGDFSMFPVFGGKMNADNSCEARDFPHKK